MKHPVLYLLLSVWCLPLCAQHCERTLVKSFNPAGNTDLLIDLPGDLSVQPWNESFVRVQFTIQLENGSEAVLKGLLVAGRYHLAGDSADVYRIHAPGLARTLPQRSKPLIEKFAIEVFAPNGMRVTQTGATETGVGLVD